MRRLALAAIAAAMAWSPLAGVVHAQGAAPASAIAVDAKRRINLSGRQRMLTQFMAKATCFVSLGIDDKAQINEVYSAHDLFEQTLADLRRGNADLKLLPEQDGAVVAALDTVQKDWALYSRAVMQGDLETIIAQNGVVLGAMNEAVVLIQQRYSTTGRIAPEIAAAINISGRQRMLSQKASKEHCLIAAELDPAGNRVSLKATIELFDRSLRALQEGDAAMGLRPAPGSAIVDALKAGQAEWAKLRPMLERVASGGKADVEDVSAVARLNVSVLEAMEDVVGLYEAHGG